MFTSVDVELRTFARPIKMRLNVSCPTINPNNASIWIGLNFERLERRYVLECSICGVDKDKRR